MSQDDSKKLSSDSEAELEALRNRVRELEDAADAAEQADEEGITKRGLVKAAWAAPVIMSVNLPNSVFAMPAMSPVTTSAPTTMAPGSPTNAPLERIVE